MEALQDKNLYSCTPMKSGLDGLLGGLLSYEVCLSPSCLGTAWWLGFAEIVKLRVVLIYNRVD